jgi:hypothetical protein
MESHNTLIIENLTTMPEYGEHTAQVSAAINAKIQFNCSLTGKMFMEIIISAEGNGYSEDRALKTAIQNFLDKRYHSEHRVYDIQVKSFASNKIHSLDIQVQEPFKSLFEQLFSNSNWEIPKKELPSK